MNLGESFCANKYVERVDRAGGGGGAGVWNFLERVLYQNLLYFTDFTLFLCTSMQ